MFNDSANNLRRTIIAYTDDPFSLTDDRIVHYLDMFHGWIGECARHEASALRHPDDEFFIDRVKEDQEVLPEIQAAIARLESFVVVRDLLTSKSPADYKVGTKLRINRSFNLGEYEVKVGMKGTRARLDSYDQSRVPAGKIPVRFKVQLFGFLGDEDFKSLVLYIPNFAVDAI